MKDALIPYAELFKEVMQIDPYLASLTKPLRDDDISEDEYFDVLYVDREARRQAQERVFSSQNKLICVVGPRGSGKSTIAKRIRREFGKDDAVFFTLYDVRYQNIGNHLINESTALDEVQRIIRNFFLDALNDKGSRNVDLLDKHLAFFVNRCLPEEDRPANTFSDFAEIVNDVSLRMAEYSFELQRKMQEVEVEERWDEALQAKEITKLKNQIKHLDVYNWVKSQREKGNHSYLRELYQKIIGIANLVHLAFAHRYIFQKKFVEEGKKVTQIFWFDNIDNLNAANQRILVNVLHKCQRQLHQITTIVIAAREENVFYEPDDFDAGAPTFRAIVFIDNPHKFKVDRAEAVNLGMTLDDDIKAIMGKRLDFFPTYFKKKKPDEDFESKIFKVLRRVVEEVVMKVFEEEKFLYVANNSLRELLPMYADLTLFLIKKIEWLKNGKKFPENEKQLPPCLTDPKFFQVTEALYWLAYEEKYFEFYNLAEYCITPRLHGGCSRPCFLPHVVLTAIWNTVNKRRRKGGHRVAFLTAKLEHVVVRIRKLGFEDEQIKRVLFSLSRPQAGRSHFIVIETKKRIKYPDDIDLNFKVRITSRGMVALNRIFNSFGYFYGMIKKFRGEEVYTTPANRLADGQLFLDYAKTMYRLHLNALREIRAHAYENANDWYHQYMEEFGIYVDPNISRKMQLSSAYRIGTRTYILYFPYLMESVLPYFNHIQSRAVHDKLDRLLQKFMQYVNQLRDGENVESFELPDGV